MEKQINTNLASEFYVMSCLFRLGADAHLTLRNKKAVDILIHRNDRETITIDVKGLQGTTSFPIDNWERKDKSHFLIFVSFVNKISVCSVLPEIYIVPSTALEQDYSELDGKSLIYQNPKQNRKVINLSSLRKLKEHYHDKWELLA